MSLQMEEKDQTVLAAFQIFWLKQTGNTMGGSILEEMAWQAFKAGWDAGFSAGVYFG